MQSSSSSGLVRLAIKRRSVNLPDPDLIMMTISPASTEVDGVKDPAAVEPLGDATRGDPALGHSRVNHGGGTGGGISRRVLYRGSHGVEAPHGPSFQGGRSEGVDGNREVRLVPRLSDNHVNG